MCFAHVGIPLRFTTTGLVCSLDCQTSHQGPSAPDALLARHTIYFPCAAGVAHVMQSGRTAVFYSCLGGHLPSLKTLSAAGADVNLLSPRNRISPLHIAAREYGNGHKVGTDSVRVLLMVI